MKNILVIDVAAEKGGALSVLNEYIEKFSEDSDNHYFFVLSKVSRDGFKNIHFIQLPWVKRSYLHRLYFDLIYVQTLISKYSIDEIYSLQNNAFMTKKIPQTVLLHNALFFSENHYSFKESKSIWIYQNIISKYVKFSLMYANTIIVQANWIKNLLVDNWGIKNSQIVVCRPNIQIPKTKKYVSLPPNTVLFYPANGSLYKNHLLLLQAFRSLNGYDCSLAFTGCFEDLSMPCQDYILNNNLSVSFLGRLSKEEIYYVYENSILVFPSLVETVGLPLLEANLLGGTILAPNLPYAKELLGDDRNVSYFDPNSVESLTNIIKEKLL